MGKRTFFTQSMRITLVLPQAAWLSTFLLENQKCCTSVRGLNYGHNTDRIEKRRKKPGAQPDLNPWPQEFSSAGVRSTVVLQPLTRGQRDITQAILRTTPCTRLSLKKWIICISFGLVRQTLCIFNSRQITFCHQDVNFSAVSVCFSWGLMFWSTAAHLWCVVNRGLKYSEGLRWR